MELLVANPSRTKGGGRFDHPRVFVDNFKTGGDFAHL